MIFQKFYKNSLTGYRGFILIDVLVALSLAAIFITMLLESSEHTRQSFERARIRDQVLDAYVLGQASTSSKLYGNDRIQVSELIDFKDIASGTIIFSKVTPRSVSDLRDFAGTPLCDVDFTSGHLDAVPIFKSVALPIDPQLPLTDLEIRNGIAYVSADSVVAADPDILIIDIHDMQSPKLISALNTGPGIASIALSGQRIYAAATSLVAQLHVIRLNSLYAPVIETKYKLPLPFASATPPLASTIFFDRDLLYVGTEKWAGDEFNVLNVADPTQPVKVAGLEIGSKVNDILVHNGSAYVASADQDQLRLIDVTDRGRLQLLNYFSPAGWQRQEGQTISSFEDSIAFGRTSGGYNVRNELELFSWPAEASSTLSGQFSADIAGGVYGIVTDRSNMYVITRELDREFQIWRQGTSTAYSLPVMAQTLTCDGDRLYILAHNAPYIYEISFK